MPKMERIFIRIDPETGALLRKWFTSQGTTLADAIQDFLMEEYEKALAADPYSLEEPDEVMDVEVSTEEEVLAGEEVSTEEEVLAGEEVSPEEEVLAVEEVSPEEEVLIDEEALTDEEA